jgi:hypothetical protein
MFSTMASPFPAYNACAQSGLMAVQTELTQLKSAPVLNPQFGMVIRYLDCLNKLIEPMTMSQGPLMGVRSWLIEVQYLVKVLHRRTFQNMPL